MLREKPRIPAWCDRVLRKGDILKQIDYSTAPLRFSDHRPVWATFQCTVNDIDEAKKQRLGHEVYIRRRRDIGDNTANSRNNNADDEDQIGQNPVVPELPSASSDRRKWWLDSGKRFYLLSVRLHNCQLICRIRTTRSIRYQGPQREVDSQSGETFEPFHSDGGVRLD